MKIRNFLIYSVLICAIPACDNDGDSFPIGDVFSDNQAVMGYVDTFSLKLSTIKIDSFATSGYSSSMFLGYYKDEKVGNVLTEMYAPIIFSSTLTIPENSIYDSLVICFKPSGVWVGDTVTPKFLNISRVLQKIEPHYDAEKQKMFNHQRLQRDTTPLARVTISPNPGRKLVSTARMSDELGNEWFKMLLESNDVMSNTEYFLDYFKGLAIVPDVTDFTWGLGFTTNGMIPRSNQIEDATQFEIRLYYRRPSDGEDDSYLTFVLANDIVNQYKYTYLNNDRTGTPFEKLKKYDDKVYSSESGSVSYVQTGSGLALRIDMPTLNNLHSVAEYMNVIDARLIIKPKENSFDDDVYKLPSTLYVGLTDESNKTVSYLSDMNGNAVSSQIYYTNNEKTPFYSFQLIGFVRSRIMSPSEDYNSIVILPSEEEIATSFKRLVVDDYTNYGENVQLQVYYLTY